VKKLKIFKTAILLVTLTMGSLAWGNDNEKSYAECTTYGSDISGGYEFHIPRPNGDKIVFVKGKHHVGLGGEKYVESIVRHSSWVTTLAKFEFEGKYIEIDFSNYLSPSIGSGTIDGEVINFACQLNGLSF
jgi:hypothetical protein